MADRGLFPGWPKGEFREILFEIWAYLGCIHFVENWGLSTPKTSKFGLVGRTPNCKELVQNFGQLLRSKTCKKTQIVKSCAKVAKKLLGGENFVEFRLPSR